MPNRNSPIANPQEKIENELSCVASYDPTSDSYRITLTYPAIILDPLLDLASRINITIPTKELRERKDAIVHRLLAD